MINIGDKEITIMLGNAEIPAIYCGDLQIYPSDFGTLTGITIDNLTWIKDVPYTGGTASSANCSFYVTAYYDSGKTRKVTGKSTITGSMAVPATTIESRQYIGDLTLTASYEGFSDSATIGVYQEPYSNYDSFKNKYLTFKVTNAGNIVLYNPDGSGLMYYRLNGGSWDNGTSAGNTLTLPVVAGDIVEWKTTGYVKAGSSGRSPWRQTTAGIEIYGNLMSLKFGDEFNTKTSFNISGWIFQRTFANITGLTSAENMYIPENTTFQKYSAEYLFDGCTSLTKAPKILTRDSFTLYTRCFDYAFRNCTSLTKGPELLKTSVTNNAYLHMFYGCTNLNYVKCLLTSPSTSNQDSWMYGVGSTGTFVKASGVSWSTGTSGIPSGWTVQEE